MTVPRWPPELPRALRQGYSRSRPDGRQSTQPEVGPPRVRRRFSAAIAPMTMTIDVSADQRMRFSRFWEEDTGFGSLPFLIPDWTIDGLDMGTASGSSLTTANGETLEIAASLLVMFGRDPPTEIPVGIRYRITFQLSIMP